MSSIYEIITEKMLAQLDKGTVPWHKPWSVGGGAVSHTTGKPYSLINQILLLEEDESVLELPNREYVTFNQIKAEGGRIKKGEKSKMVVFWKMLKYDEKDERGEVVLKADGNPVQKVIPMLRYYNVWEVSQCDGINRKHETAKTENNIVEEAERIVEKYFGREACTLDIAERDRAYYSPSKDTVCVPLMEQFEATEFYYSTLFHEMTHSTGHSSRLDRKFGDSFFGGEDYSKEELVAEFGSAYLLNIAGIDTQKAFKNSAAYIAGWSEQLKKDSHLFVNAAGKAEAAVNFILGTNIQQQTENAQERI